MYDLPHHKAKNEQDIKEFFDKHTFAFSTFFAGRGEYTFSPVVTGIVLLLIIRRNYNLDYKNKSLNL